MYSHDCRYHASRSKGKDNHARSLSYRKGSRPVDCRCGSTVQIRTAASADQIHAQPMDVDERDALNYPRSLWFSQPFTISQCGIIARMALR